MSKASEWNDESRADLRETLQWFVLGELRLARRDEDAILEAADDIYLVDDCPEAERPAFRQYAAEELRRADAQLALEMAAWPEETDCDRLDRVEAALRDRGILLWQASPCCDSCTGGELPDRMDVIERRYPGFRERVRGYAFFIDQNLPEMLSESTEISVYLGYGWLSDDDTEVAPDEYQAKALGIAREVCACLREEGFEPNWDGSIDRKVGVSVNWQRRTMLE